MPSLDRFTFFVNYDFLYWGCLASINLVISIVIYHNTKIERYHKLASEYELSTSAHPKPSISLPSSFKYISTFTGIINLCGAYLRTRRIQLLQIPTSWLTQFIGDAEIDEGFLDLVDAEWIVALNDWSNLFLAITFFLSGCFNLATVRHLRLRDLWAEKILLPAPYKSCQQDFFDDKEVPGALGEGKSFARAAPGCSKRMSVVGTLDEKGVTRLR